MVETKTLEEINTIENNSEGREKPESNVGSLKRLISLIITKSNQEKNGKVYKLEISEVWKNTSLDTLHKSFLKCEEIMKNVYIQTFAILEEIDTSFQK